MEALRTFVAVPLNPRVRAHLTTLIGRMALLWPRGAVRWIDEDHMHLTLRFLGATDPGRVPALRDGLREVAAGSQPLDLRLGACGCFPNRRRPRVVWVGVLDPGGRLAGLQKRVERIVRSCGWSRERQRFVPHLTLGRVRQGYEPPAGDWLCAGEEVPLPVRRLELIESRLRPDGAEYRSLASATLNAPAAGDRAAP